jgi:hypothetical protein
MLGYQMWMGCARWLKLARGEFSINMVFILLITIISITLLISMFGYKLPGFGKDLYCKTFFHVYSSTMIPQGMRVDKRYCNIGPAIGVVELAPIEDRLLTFADGSESKQVVNEILNVQLDSKNVTFASISFSVFDNDPRSVDVDVGGDGSVEDSFTLTIANTPYEADLTDAVRSYVEQTGNLIVPIAVIDSAGLGMQVHELKVDQLRFFPHEQLVGGMLACWELAEYGRLQEDLVCVEITIPNDFKSSGMDTIIDESEITKVLVESEGCDILPNPDGDPSCGDENSIDWYILDLKDVSNILIEYNSLRKSIVVS